LPVLAWEDAASRDHGEQRQAVDIAASGKDVPEVLLIRYRRSIGLIVPLWAD
jgi:hypothetical protein